MFPHKRYFSSDTRLRWPSISPLLIQRYIAGADAEGDLINPSSVGETDCSSLICCIIAAPIQ